MVNNIKALLSKYKGSIFTDREICIPELVDDNNKDVNNWLISVGDNDIRVDWVAEYLTIYSANNICQVQEGYQGNGWNKDWFVIANVISDPVFINLSLINSPVYFAKHGVGKWEDCIISNSIKYFAKTLDVWCNVYYKEFEGNILNDDFELNDEFLCRIRLELSHFLDKLTLENIMYIIEY